MKKYGFLILLAASSILSTNAQEARLLRFPHTNGKEVVFTYAGDLYKAPLTGGEAQRLTSHIGFEIFPHFSPDGKSIAFTGQYDGNTEVYLIPAEGGEPKRLTYTATNSRSDIGDRMGPNNIVMTWTPDGKHIIYRNRISTGFEGKLYSISSTGGMPQAIPLPEGGFCNYSPDGKKLAYNRVFREFRTWKYYRGGMADDIWIYDQNVETITNITNNDAQDIFPMWIGDEIFFASDRDLTMNLFAYNTQTGKTEKITHYTDYDIKFPSTDGTTIVYEHGGFLYRLNPKTRKTEQIHITLHGENLYARTKQKCVNNNVTAASLSPDGKRVVVTARGEVFDVPVQKGVTRNITHTPGAHEREACWSPNGKYIAYISDRTGETEVWIQTLGESTPIQLTNNNDTYIRTLQWSPDSKTLLYTDRKNRIVTINIETKKKTTVMQNPESEFFDVSYSSDSNWITYIKPDNNNMNVVYIYNLQEKKEYPVTENWYNSSNPIFSTDGKYLIFSSDRDFNPVYGSTEWNHVYTSMGGIYMAMLQKETPSPFLPKDSEVALNDSTANKNANIDTNGLFSRIVRIPLGTGNYYNFYCNGEKIWYAKNGTTYLFNLKTGENSQIADGALMNITPGSEKALFLKDKDLFVQDNIPSEPFNLNKIDLDNMIATIDYNLEWAQIFDEAWRAFRDGFYLENMHGIDWKAIKEKYKILLPHVKTRLDLNYVIGEMISELACGHAYVNPGEYDQPQTIQMGLLGAELSREEHGFYRIDKILSGAPYSNELRSPLAEQGMNIHEGDFITAIDGISTTSVTNIYQLLVGKANVQTELTINTQAKAGGRKVVVTPIDDEYPLYHYNWIQQNIKKVNEASNGRVGYIYIPDMGPEGLNEFARYFYPQLDKEGLIIDDRANGGGNVSPMIIERLLRKPYRMTMSRTSTKTGTIPDATQYGPKVLLINKYSASDGDLFPGSFKANNIGTIIGTRSWGGIIGISGSLPYMDGTDIRVPFFTNYDAKTGEWIIENHGVDPDILIDNNPIKEQEGEDEQLNKAIEVILEQLKDRKPLPKVPAPRTFKDLHLSN